MGRNRRSSYSVGDIAYGKTIVDIKRLPDKLNKRTGKLEGVGYSFKVRCRLCNDPQNDRWTNKLSEIGGCKPCYTKRQKMVPNQTSTYKALMARTRSGATKRGYKFSLTLSEFTDIVVKDCYWCGVGPQDKSPAGLRRPILPAPAHGIDRVDNSLGYLVGNCVASCEQCNVAKNKHSSKEFLEWVERVYENSTLKGIK